jgi:dihydroorotase
MNIQIKNGRLIDPKNKLDAQQDVYISERRIVAIGLAPQGFVASQVIDAAGMIVMPGLVDIAANPATNTRPRWNPKWRRRWRAA